MNSYPTMEHLTSDVFVLKFKYHLVMTNSLPWKDPPIFKFGKPSISMGHGLTMAMLVITRG